MKDNSALILGDKRSGLVAGLEWQFVTGADSRSQIRDIRRMAAELDVKACVRLGRAMHGYAGFYAWEADLSDEKRPNRVYSFAALLSHRLHPSHAIVAWRIAQGPKQGQYALVVIEDHLPVADLVLSLAQAKAAIERYRRAPDHGAADGFWSNDLEEFPQAQPMLLDWPEIRPGKNERIRALPSDPVGLAASLMGAALLVSGLLVASEYSGYRMQAEHARNDAQEKAAKAYEQDLQWTRTRLGAESASVSRLLDQWLDEPAVFADWSLSNVNCDAQQCIQTWQSEGGYTSALISALKGQSEHTAQTDLSNPQRMQVRTTRQLNMSGVSAFDELPDAKSLQQLLFDEEQVWTKARITHRVDLHGVVWPAGHEPASNQAVLRRHEITLTAAPNIVRYMLQDYAGLAWWNRMQLHVKPFDTKQVLLVELQGAFYAY